jgi:hypothetical protein
MKTLVIHPKDKSTEFLKEIYLGKGWTINNDIYGSRKKVIEQIKEHDRIIMMGHGCPSGLFYTPIRPDLVYLLRKKECVCIWCNADKFVLRYGLKGFYTGMFISEVGEARYFNIDATQEEVDYSNDLFTKAVTKYIDSKDMWSQIIEAYRGDDLVIQYNNQRLYYYDGNYDGDELDKFENKILTY